MWKHYRFQRGIYPAWAGYSFLVPLVSLCFILSVHCTVPCRVIYPSPKLLECSASTTGAVICPSSIVIKSHPCDVSVFSISLPENGLLFVTIHKWHKIQFTILLSILFAHRSNKICTWNTQTKLLSNETKCINNFHVENKYLKIE